MTYRFERLLPNVLSVEKMTIRYHHLWVCSAGGGLVAESPVDVNMVDVPAHRAAMYRKHGWWLPEMLDDLVLRHCAVQPDRCAAVSGERRLSYAELASAVGRAARRLGRIGIQAGERVLVQLPNDVEFLVLVLGLVRLGAAPVLAMPALREHELRHVLGVTRPAAMAVPRSFQRFDHLAMAQRLQDGSSVRLLLVHGDPGGHIDLSRLCFGRDFDGDGEGEGRGFDAEGEDSISAGVTRGEGNRAATDNAVYLLSSGTTGPPKAIPRSHEAFGHVIRTSAAVSGLSAQSVYLALMPATHSFVFSHPGILGTLAAGGTVVFATSDDPRHVFSLVEKEAVTHVALVPALAAQWLSVARAAGGDPAGTRAARALSSLRVMQAGGARLDAATARGLQQVLGCRVQQVYGMSEGLLHFTRLDDLDEVVTQTQGRPASPGDEVLVVDEGGEQVAPGGVGELIARGPSVIAGYYGDPEANRRAFTDAGYYRTGDLVRLHPSGNYVVAGRTKDVINRGGEKIAADELEELVSQHPQVHRVAAVAMPHRLYGEAVCLYVVPAGDGSPRLHEIRGFLEARGLARYKLPARVELVDALPMVGVGKVDKVLLRKQIADLVAAERAAKA
jgi:2,3-dihydroxybenzoate-AMP ligase